MILHLSCSQIETSQCFYSLPVFFSTNIQQIGSWCCPHSLWGFQYNVSNYIYWKLEYNKRFRSCLCLHVLWKNAHSLDFLIITLACPLLNTGREPRAEMKTKRALHRVYLSLLFQWKTLRNNLNALIRHGFVSEKMRGRSDNINIKTDRFPAKLGGHSQAEINKNYKLWTRAFLEKMNTSIGIFPISKIKSNYLSRQPIECGTKQP